MKEVLLKIFTHMMAIALFVVVLPLLIFETLLKSFWTIFGSWCISLMIIIGLGGTMEQCLLYSTSLSFFVGVYLRYRDENKS
jgi:cyanate permease